MSEPEATPAPRSVPEVVLHVEGKDAVVGVRVTDGDGATPAEPMSVTQAQLAAFAALPDQPTDDQVDAAQAAMLAVVKAAPKAHARLRQYVPGPEAPSPVERVLVASTSAAVHRLPFELLTLQGARSTTWAEPGRTDRWNIVRFAEVGVASPEPEDRPPRVLVVVGRQGQAEAVRDGRPLVIDLLAAIAGARHGATLHVAMPVAEHAALSAFAGRDQTFRPVADLLADPSRCLPQRATDTLLRLLRGDALSAEIAAAPRGPYDIVLMLGHSFEGDVARAHGLTREAVAFDLGLLREDGLPPGPTFAEMREALAHGHTRLVGVFACLVGSEAALELLHSVDHVLLTCARVRVDDATSSLRALLETLLLERRSIDVVTRRARGALPVSRAWILQQWTRTRSLRVLADQIALALGAYRRAAAAKTSDDLLGTLLEDLALRVEEAIGLGPGGDAANAKAEYAHSRRRSPHAPDSGGVFAGHSTLRGHLDAYRDGAEPRLKTLVVLAPPGAGKTVLLQGERQRLAADPDAFWIPVLVRLREWVRDDAAGDILRFAVARVRGVTTASIRDDDLILRALHDAQHHRRIAFLLDGLDEVSPAARDKLLPRLRALAAVPGCPIVVTSRPIGFVNPGGFTELWLQPLEAERQQQLVARRHPGRAEVWDTLTRRFEASPSLAHLSGNPLFLTLMADLAAGGSEIRARPYLVLQDVIGFLLHQKHRPEAQRLPYAAPSFVLEVLRRLAFSWTKKLQAEWSGDDLRLWTADDQDHGRSAAERLETDLRASGDWGSAADFGEWLVELGRRTGIVSHRGAAGQRTFEFRHRAFQELLCAERLREVVDVGDRDPADVLSAVLGDGGGADREATETLVNYWAEPFALLTGEIPNAGAWILALVAAKRTKPIALRALANARHLLPEAVAEIVAKLDDWRDRVAVYDGLSERVDRAQVVDVLDRLRRARTHSNDLWHLRDVAQRLAAGGVQAAGPLAHRIFDHLPPPRARDFAWVPRLGRRAVGLEESLWREIPAATFTMGSPESEEGREEDEEQVKVTIAAPFWAMATPVTLAMFRAFDSAHRHRWDDVGDLPVTEVTWFAASAFCAWLNEGRGDVLQDLARWQPGLARVPGHYEFRLPTEAEWEYACRAGTETRYWSGDERRDLVRVGWHGQVFSRVKAVAALPANPWGLHDMHGNVWEWCWDWWGVRLTGLPWGPPSGRGRVQRGGCFRSDARWCRSGARYWTVPGWSSSGLGFRVVLAAAPQS